MKRTLPSIAAIGSIVALVAVPAFADTFQPKESMFAPPDVSWNSVVTGEIQGPATATFTDYTFDLSSLLDQQDGTVGDDGIFAPQFTSAFPGGKAKTWGMQFDLSLTDHGTTLFQDGTFVDHALMDAVAGKGWSWTSDTYEMGAKFTPQDAWVDGNVDISAVGTVLGDQQREMIQLSGLIPAINVTDDGFKQAMVVSGGYDTEASGVQFDVVTEADGGTTPAFKQFAVLPTYTERGDQLSSGSLGASAPFVGSQLGVRHGNTNATTRLGGGPQPMQNRNKSFLNKILPSEKKLWRLGFYEQELLWELFSRLDFSIPSGFQPPSLQIEGKEIFGSIHIFRKIRILFFIRYSMKTMTASVASKEFGKYMDEVQHEPVVITRQNRPIALTISMKEAEKFLQYKIEAGIQRGLDDITAGNYAEMTPDYIRDMKQGFISEQV